MVPGRFGQWIQTAAAVALMGAAAACGGYGQSPAAPGPPMPALDALVIDVVGIRGAQSFSPSPSTAAPGKTIVWHNTDSTVHRIVFDDGELDTGNIAPGASSGNLPLVQPGRYHCSIHPEMVGVVEHP